MKTLLEKAKEIEPSRVYSKVSRELIDLSIAWLKDDLTTKQVSFSLGGRKTSYNSLYKVSLALKQAYKNGMLVLKNK